MSHSHYCPACQAPLGQLSDSEPVLCGACGGAFLSSLVAARFDSLSYDVITGEKAHSYSYECQCPTCESVMNRRLLQRVGAVDACAGCGALWVGPGRLSRLEEALAGVQNAVNLDEANQGLPASMWPMVGLLSAISAAAAWVLTARVM